MAVAAIMVQLRFAHILPAHQQPMKQVFSPRFLMAQF
jgi:hypothetical protein